MYNLTNTILAQAEPVKIVGIALLVIVILVPFVFLLLFLKIFRLWLQAKLSRADVKFSDFIGMWLRKVNISTIVKSKITAVQAGLTLTTRDLESHFLARGNVPNVVRALISASRANIDLSLQAVTAIDLAGCDILEAGQTGAGKEQLGIKAGVDEHILFKKVSNMKTNPRLKAIIIEVVDNQLRANDPPETRSTLGRLIKEGHSENNAKELIACVVTSEIFGVMKNKEEFNHQRYVDALNKLPQLPWD